MIAKLMLLIAVVLFLLGLFGVVIDKNTALFGGLAFFAAAGLV